MSEVLPKSLSKVSCLSMKMGKIQRLRKALGRTAFLHYPSKRIARLTSEKCLFWMALATAESPAARARKESGLSSLMPLASGLPTEVTALSLGLASNGVHDGVLRVHADGRVVLRVDDGGLAAQPLHLDGLVGGQGRILQGVGVEAFLVVRTGGRDMGRVQERGGRRKGQQVALHGMSRPEQAVWMCRKRERSLRT